MAERALRAVGATGLFVLCVGAVGCMTTDGLAGGGEPSGAATGSVTPKMVFVTSRVYGATLGGYSGADAACKAAADASTLDGMHGKKWTAVLAGSSTTLGEAKWSMPSGDVVAATTAALIAGKLETELASDENGNVTMYTDPRDVWTGGTIGAAPIADCARWTSTNATAIVGHPIDTDTTWDLGPAPCASQEHLYCAEL